MRFRALGSSMLEAARSLLSLGPVRSLRAVLLRPCRRDLVSAVRWSLVVILLTGLPGLGFAGTVLERTLAFVNKKPVLQSDVALAMALLQIEEGAALDRTIDEVLMYDEASRLVSDALPDEEVNAAAETLREKAGPTFSAAALRRKAITQLTISKYIDLRLRPLVRIEDAEVRRKFNERVAVDPLAPAFNLVAQSIREALEARALDQQIEEWVASLRRREPVRRVLPRAR